MNESVDELIARTIQIATDCGNLVQSVNQKLREDLEEINKIVHEIERKSLQVLLIIILFSGLAYAEIDDSQAVRAMVGEASNQGYEGMLAVACAIRNRGTLDGVYGLHAKHVNKEPDWVWSQARRAWKESKYNDITQGSNYWENVKAFGEPKWAKAMVPTVKIKDHQFYRSK